MFAGIGGRGAEDGWYQTSVRYENARRRGLDFTCGAADVFKCFDQFISRTIYQLAVVVGMPFRIRKVHHRFQEGLIVRNSVVGGLGCFFTTSPPTFFRDAFSE